MRKSDQLTHILLMFPRMVTEGSFLHVVFLPPKKKDYWCRTNIDIFVIRHLSLSWENREFAIFCPFKSLVWTFPYGKIVSFIYLKMFFWLLATYVLTCVIGQDDDNIDGVVCIVHHLPDNNEFSCASLCHPTLIQAEIVTSVFLIGFHANFDCVKNKTSVKNRSS
jgi:hypothetical protein